MTTHHHIHVVGPRRAVSSILSRHFTEDGTLDFNTLIPMPDELREYSLEEGYLTKTYGFSNSIEWARTNWGSGRNAEQGILDEVSFVSNGESWFDARFITEDTPAYGAIRKLSEMYPDVHIYLSYLYMEYQVAYIVAYLNGADYSVESCNAARMARTLFSIDVPQQMWCNALIDTPNRGYRAIRLS